METKNYMFIGDPEERTGVIACKLCSSGVPLLPGGTACLIHTQGANGLL